MLIIRTMEKKDEAVILEMMKDFYNSPACLHTVPEENFRRTLAEAVAGNPCVRVLILEEQEVNDPQAEAVTLGYAHFTVSWNNEAGGEQIWFDELYLKAEARGKGCGTKVFRWIEEHYPDVKRIRLEVTKENTRAISLYERLGYGELPYYQMCKDF
ncbi:GNAT family N-acetyltransferase [Faecalicatena contorta]|uniref:GNAT family N-acetyltransferase n=1 Tax=Faecalicatena fissicatena TaxID=290055 RepID=A0ABS2E5N6_9FIRM|nr:MULTISPECIES: GNAT family N-acetyltransferase [Faecalicatena]MBM6684602.1 GNAT family N-acetyltransferase [Faecalicatena contorta]MBM6709854.1 GNAT family N-acetyltransferase [Faecalicatena contorta]MBM6736943.1 GNAT family N-acetyltransferase [Faecalicatena fissicatena]HIX99282.1 GNAT family N-acetyltransferase [Candidatus Dorea intestinigallinarum]